MLHGPVKSALLATALLVSACASSSKPTFEQVGYRELGFPRSEHLDYLESGKLRAGEGFFSKPQFSLDVQRRVDREKLLILTGAPYISEQSRAALSKAKIVSAETPGGFSIQTSLGDLVGPVSGGVVGASFALDALSEDFPDPTTCAGGDAVGALVCSLFYAGAIAVVAGGTAIGSGIGAINQSEENARQKLANEIREKLGEVRPLADLISAFESELETAVFRDITTDAPLAGLPAKSDAPSTGQYAWLVDDTPIISFDDVPERLALSSVPVQLTESPNGQSGAILAIGMDKFGLYPVREAGELRYSLAIVADFTFFRPVSNVSGASGDEVVLSAGSDFGASNFVVQHRKFPIVRPSFSLERWRDEGSALLSSELDAAIQNLSDRMVDYSVRLYRLDAGSDTPGVFRLKPIAPTNRVADFGDDLAWALNPLNVGSAPPSAITGHETGCMPAQLGTRTPTFTWSSVPVAMDETPIAVPAETVRFDLRIFDAGLREVLRADGLDRAVYQVSEPLDARTVYYWTIRGRFEIDGEQRVTDWAVCNSGRNYPHVFDEAPNLYFPVRTPNR